jgi:23S rRNA (adenine2503-C2)-methyltransferase
MLSIYDKTYQELCDEIKPSFRAKQIYGWLYNKYVSSYDEMKNIPKALKEELNSKYTIDIAKIINEEVSSDGSRKYLFKFHDGHTVEAVLLLMKEEVRDENGKVTSEEKYTFCISSQIGCKIGCSFCLTAKGGFVRDLTPGEIVYQVVALKKLNNIPMTRKVNLVYMGMGEPLDNYDNLVQAIKILSEENGLAIGLKRQTISTSGISPKIKKLGEDGIGVNLAISLHAVDNDLREELIPLNKAYDIDSIIEAVKQYPVDRRKKILFEYLVIKDKNDSIDSAKKLVKLLNGIQAKVNLIYFNPYPGTDYKRPDPKDMIKFQEYLLSKGVICTIRESKGLDISAACGQLREKNKI